MTRVRGRGCRGAHRQWVLGYIDRVREGKESRTAIPSPPLTPWYPGSSWVSSHSRAQSNFPSVFHSPVGEGPSGIPCHPRGAGVWRRGEEGGYRS